MRTVAAIACCAMVTIAQGMLVGAPAMAANCGGVNQRACKVFERIPSCNRGLVERRGNCVEARAPTPRPVVCGDLNQRACKVSERVPSCNRGLSEFRGQCVESLSGRCGGPDQRPCKAWERIPSCDKGLIEYARPNVCAPPKQAFVCGALNQRPCLVNERVPSCDRGLFEDLIKNLCVEKSNVASAVDLAKQCYRDFEPMAVSYLRLAHCTQQPPVLRVLRPLLRQKQSGKLREVLLEGACVPELKAAADTMRSRGFKSLSIGVGGDVGAGLGATSEFFVAVDTNLRGKAYIYESLGWRLGSSVGGSVNAVVTGYFAPASQLAGTGQGFSVSLKALGGAGGAVGLSYAEKGQSPRCTSFSAAAGAGAEVNAGSLGRTITRRLTN